MKKYTALLVISLFTVLYACQPQAEEPNTNESSTENVSTSTTIYKINTDSVDLKWTAYKTNERLGVSGTFNEIRTESNKQDSTIGQLIDGIRFEINTASVFSGNDIRDPKLVDHFFGLMVGEQIIRGEIIQTDGTEGGDAIVRIEMNGESNDIEAEFELVEGRVVLTSALDLADWKAESSVAALNKACEDLHTGSDGISKLWPDVSLEVSALLEEVASSED